MYPLSVGCFILCDRTRGTEPRRFTDVGSSDWFALVNYLLFKYVFKSL